MPASTLHILANCTDRKRLAPDADRRLRHYASVPIAERFAGWASALSKAQRREVCARDLYVGPYWSAVRQIENEARRVGFRHVCLSVLSAGYGLVQADERIGAYSSTFATGAPDSVVRPDDTDRRTVLLEWWRLLATMRRRERNARRTITSLAQADRRASFIIIASPAYVDAITDDLTEALDLVDDPDRFVVITSKVSEQTGLHANWVRSSESLLARVGGARTSLHARVALDLISNTKGGRLSAVAARSRYDRFSRNAPPVVRYERDVKTDGAVTKFIERELRRDPSVTHTGLLREFRGRGMACEQKRFRQLFRLAHGRA